MTTIIEQARALDREARQEEHLTVKVLAKHWGVTERMVWKLIRAGSLHAHRVGRWVRVAPEEVHRYERDNVIAECR